MCGDPAAVPEYGNYTGEVYTYIQDVNSSEELFCFINPLSVPGLEQITAPGKRKTETTLAAVEKTET